MSVVRKVVGRSAAQLSRAGSKTALRMPQTVAQRSFSTMLEGREKAEEARYIRKMETEKHDAIRAKVERILALEDGHDEKAELFEMIEEKKVDDSMLAKLGLNDWKFALPIGLMVGIPALANEVLVLDAETQLVACFILFCSTLYTQVGASMAKSLDDYAKEIADELKEVDESMLESIHSAVEADQMALSLDEDYKQYCTLTDQLAVAQADVLNYKEAHLYRDAIVKKLDSLSALEESAMQAIRNRMMTEVKADVVNSFQTDKKVKDAALARAIEVLAAGAKGTMGQDVVGEAFSASLARYKANYAKQPEGADPILAQLEKDMAAIAVAPVVEATGGNVYETHPIA